jgi:LuxR family maltose regulon positive regulatory protein
MIELLQRAMEAGIHRDFTQTVLAAARRVQRSSVSREPPLKASQPLIEPLTNRELDVLELLMQRMQDKEMAERLSVSPQTIKAHLRSIYQKLAVNGRRQAADRAMELGLLNVSQ